MHRRIQALWARAHKGPCQGQGQTASIKSTRRAEGQPTSKSKRWGFKAIKKKKNVPIPSQGLQTSFHGQWELVKASDGTLHWQRADPRWAVAAIRVRVAQPPLTHGAGGRGGRPGHHGTFRQRPRPLASGSQWPHRPNCDNPERSPVFPGSRVTKLPPFANRWWFSRMWTQGNWSGNEANYGLGGKRHAGLRTAIGDSLKVGARETREVKSKIRKQKGAKKILREMLINPWSYSPNILSSVRSKPSPPEQTKALFPLLDRSWERR